MKLVEQELWQREEKGLIGILPVRDAAEIKPVGPTVSEGDKLFFIKFNFYTLSVEIFTLATNTNVLST